MALCCVLLSLLINLLLYNKIERIDFFLYALTLCNYSVMIVAMVVSTNWKFVVT